MLGPARPTGGDLMRVLRAKANRPRPLRFIGMSTSPTAAQTLTVLGIETSCDETAAAVVTRDVDGRGRILANAVLSQFDAHRLYGGVVPEIAARAHTETLDKLIAAALADADLPLAEVDAIAAASGPGLIGGLIVGAITGKALALATGKPFLAINHLEAHALTVGLTDSLPPPYLMLLVSGGHTQILLVDSVGQYRRLATTIDDALGEAFDKTAKLLGLGMPGGPAVEAAAGAGIATRFALPRPMLGRADPHFSFAGLKTAVRHAAQAIGTLSDRDVADLCAGFQAAVSASVADRVRLAMHSTHAHLLEQSGRADLVVAGGVAANLALKKALQEVAAANGFNLIVPPPALCTDNGAMIAWAGAERLAAGFRDGLDAPVRPRWPLDPSAPAAIGAGVKA